MIEWLRRSLVFAFLVAAICYLAVCITACHVHLITIEPVSKNAENYSRNYYQPQPAAGLTVTTQPEQVRPSNLDAFMGAVREQNH